VNVDAVEQVGDVGRVVVRFDGGHARSGAAIVLGGERVIASRSEDLGEAFVAVYALGEAREHFPGSFLGVVRAVGLDGTEVAVEQVGDWLALRPWV